jgi:hypothetical protein
MNAGEAPLPFTLPPGGGDGGWAVLLDTAEPEVEGRAHAPGTPYPLAGRASALLRFDPPA